MFPATDVLIQLTFHTADTQWGHKCSAGHLTYKFAKNCKFISRSSDLTKVATLYDQTCILTVIITSKTHQEKGECYQPGQPSR